MMRLLARVTEDEYLARELVAETKSELVNGHILAMAGASIRHNAIASRLIVALGSRLRGRPCQPYGSDQRVHVPATGLYTYPDVTVACAPLERHPKNADTLLNPRALFEVLSDGTEAFDRGAKFAHYRSIASLQTYVLVSQHEPRVEWYERGTAGFVLHEAVGIEATVHLGSLDLSFPLSELYSDLPPLD